VAGMNTGERAELMREIEAIRGRGYTILMIEHDMRFVMGLCETIAVLNFGKIIASGPPEAIRNNEQVIEAYLGRDDDEEGVAQEGSHGAPAQSLEKRAAMPAGEIAERQEGKK
jgi:branched-chain amino acid transport system ATP-binding protein